jgi:hypothetical protein
MSDHYTEYLQINMVKYNADWEITIIYENVQIVWSHFFTDLLLFVYIRSTSNIYWFIGIVLFIFKRDDGCLGTFKLSSSVIMFTSNRTTSVQFWFWLWTTLEPRLYCQLYRCWQRQTLRSPTDFLRLLDILAGTIKLFTAVIYGFLY